MTRTEWLLVVIARSIVATLPARAMTGAIPAVIRPPTFA